MRRLRGRNDGESMKSKISNGKKGKLIVHEKGNKNCEKERGTALNIKKRVKAIREGKV